MYAEKSAKSQASRLFPGCREEGYMQDAATVKEQIKALSENNNSKAQVKAIECIKNWDTILKNPEVAVATEVELFDRFTASKHYPEMVAVINDEKLSDEDKILLLKDIIITVEEESQEKLAVQRKTKEEAAKAKAKVKDEEEEEEKLVEAVKNTVAKKKTTKK